MAHINDELGIPVNHAFENLLSPENYLYARGRGKAKVKNFFGKVAQAPKKAISKSPVGFLVKKPETQRVTGEDRKNAENWVASTYGNKILASKSLAELDTNIGLMADAKEELFLKLGKEKSGVGKVLSFGRQYKRRGAKAGLCTTDSCIRESKARLDAIAAFETKNKSTIDALYKKYGEVEKPVEPAASEKEGTSPQVGKADTGTPAATSELGGTTDGGATGSAITNALGKDKNKIILYAVGGLVAVGALYAILKNN